jgi:hypothetical protein
MLVHQARDEVVWKREIVHSTWVDVEHRAHHSFYHRLGL